jgi:uncharacterized membrane protein
MNNESLPQHRARYIRRKWIARGGIPAGIGTVLLWVIERKMTFDEVVSLRFLGLFLVTMVVALAAAYVVGGMLLEVGAQ